MKNEHEIAYDLERIVEKELGFDFDHSGTFFDRDVIHKDCFYSVMYFMLHIKGGKGSVEFMNKYYELRGVNMNDIKDYEQIFNEFKSLIDNTK